MDSINPDQLVKNKPFRPKKSETSNRPMNGNTKPIDWKWVDKMLQAHATREGIAGLLNMTADNFSVRIIKEKGTTFTTYAQEKIQEGNSLVIGRQFSSAMSGNTAMLKLLGEEWLGQGRKQDQLTPADPLSDTIREILDKNQKMEETNLKQASQIEALIQENDELKRKAAQELPRSDQTL